MKRIQSGWYEFDYNGHHVELIEAKQNHGHATTLWLIAIDQSCDITARTKAEAKMLAMEAIDARFRP